MSQISIQDNNLHSPTRYKALESVNPGFQKVEEDELMVEVLRNGVSDRRP